MVQLKLFALFWRKVERGNQIMSLGEAFSLGIDVFCVSGILRIPPIRAESRENKYRCCTHVGKPTYQLGSEKFS